MTVKSLPCVTLGLMDYGEALAIQLKAHQACLAGTLANGAVFCVEHPAVLTLGKHADLSFLTISQEDFAAKGVSVISTDRGGEVTAHMPGQMVVYPILPFTQYGLTPKKYIGLLEQSVIHLLNDYGINANTDPEHPGVWVKGDKICAIGIRIKERVSLHGIALNVGNSLELFKEIVPCGIRGRGVCTMSELLSRTVCVEEVWERYKMIIAKLLSVNSYRLSASDLLGA